ncbi:TPA: hypothetical protein ACH3X1_015627 [Trebouxia sp. C0004]
MGIIDDHYGGYDNLALYSDGHGGFDVEAAYGTTLESTIDARIKAVCHNNSLIGSDCVSCDSKDYESDGSDFGQEDNPLLDPMRGSFTNKQAAQLLAGMLAGALIHRQNMRVTRRERDLTHLVDLIQSQLCKGQPDRALQLLGMDVVLMGMAWQVGCTTCLIRMTWWGFRSHLLAMQGVVLVGVGGMWGCSAGGYGVGWLLHHTAHKKGWDVGATAKAMAKVHHVDSVFSERNNLVDDCHLMACFDTEPTGQSDSFPDNALKHIRLGELFSWRRKQ